MSDAMSGKKVLTLRRVFATLKHLQETQKDLIVFRNGCSHFPSPVLTDINRIERMED